MEPKDFYSIDRDAPASVLTMRWFDNGQTLIEHKCATLAEVWHEISRFKENGDDVVAIKVDGNVIEPEHFDLLQEASL
ncbi:hypothetical protein BFN67_15185 [Pseudaminobacter manganicus]|uniref:Uncharacterized protein n=2 Tax=Manganibacter manganicus TaxID=1873176 RepID=A0A1V8RSQ2_9HYPH|nr:hypothetical protein BFN67_15185 [Pseudaminobacter manganicus]